MNRHARIFVTIAVISMVAMTTGCATMSRDLVRENTLNIEKVSSKIGTVTDVHIVQDESQVRIYGELTHSTLGRGTIPGHVDLEVIGPDGDVLEQTTIEYHRRSMKSKISTFHSTLQTMPPVGSTIRVIHNTSSLMP